MRRCSFIRRESCGTIRQLQPKICFLFQSSLLVSSFSLVQPLRSSRSLLFSLLLLHQTLQWQSQPSYFCPSKPKPACLCVRLTAGVNERVRVSVEVDRLIKGTVQSTFYYLSLWPGLLFWGTACIGTLTLWDHLVCFSVLFCSLNTCHIISESATYVQI